MSQTQFEWSDIGNGAAIVMPKSATKANSIGLKYDADKPSMELLDPYALEEMARVLGYGAKKYEEFNWKKGIEWGRVLGAVLRHTMAYMRGEDNDPETGINHMAHVAVNAMFLVWFAKNRKEYDNRYVDSLSGNSSSSASSILGEKSS